MMSGSSGPRGNLGIAGRLAIVSFLFLLIFYDGHFDGSDENAFFKMTRSIYEEGSLAVPQMPHTEQGPDGRYYSHFSLGQSLVALPFYALGKLASAVLPEPVLRALAGPKMGTEKYQWGGTVEIFAVGLHGPVMSALLVALFFLFQRQLGVSVRNAVVCSLLLATTTYVAIMSTFFLRHTSEALTITGGLYFFYRWKQGGRARDLWAGSALASLTLLVRFVAGVAGPALAGYLGWCLYTRSKREPDSGTLARALPPIAVPLLVVIAASVTGDFMRWGKPWNVPQLQSASHLGTPLYVSVYAFLFSPGISVFVYSPLLLLVPRAFPALWRRHRAEAIALGALSLSFLIAFSSYSGWTGLWSSPGPRYQFISTPLLLLSLGLWLDETRGRAKWAWVSLLAGVGAIVQIVSMTVVWGGVIHIMRYKAFEPEFSFLFLPEHSPVIGAMRLFSEGRFIDLWIWRLSEGWRGQDPQPLAALVILATWAGLFTISVLALRRKVLTAG